MHGNWRILPIILGGILLSSCATYYMHKYDLPDNMKSTAQADGSFHHAFAPDRVNYAVCGDSLWLLWGKQQGESLNLFLGEALKPLQWQNVQFVLHSDTTSMQEWGAIPSELPVDFDCRQQLLTSTTQGKAYEIFQSPVQSPFRCSSLYDQWVTVVNRSNRKALVTDIPLGRDVEFLQWAGKLWVADAQGMTGFDLEHFQKDQDGDGLSDILEGLLGTLPNQVDSDKDGIDDILDPQPMAGPRDLNAEEIGLRIKLEQALLALPQEGACTQFVNVEAPMVHPFEAKLPQGMRLVWNAPHWRGTSIKL